MKPDLNSHRWLTWLLGLIVLALVGTASVDRFWVIDTGLNWWQTHYGDLLAVNSPDDPAYGELPWLQPHTPAADYFAVPAPFAYQTERGPRIVFGSLYPALNRLFDIVAGEWGVRLLMLFWWGVLIWALRRLKAADNATFLLLLSTPLLFYGVQVWSHFAAAAVLLLALSWRERPLAAGVLLMLAVLLRLEAVVVIPVLVGYQLRHREWRRSAFMLGATVIIVAGWGVWNYYATGHWLPLQWLANRGGPEARWTFDAIGSRLEYLLVPLRSYPLTGVAVLAGLIGVWRLETRTGQALLWLCAIHSTWLVYVFYSDPLILNHLGRFASFLAAAPLLLPAFRLSPERDTKPLQLIFWTALGLALLLLPLRTGFHWGARWLVVLIPLAAVIAARQWRSSGLKWLPLTLLLTSLALQAGSVQLLRERQGLQQEYVERIQAEDSRVILTDQRHWAGTLPDLMARHEVLLFENFAELRHLVTTLRDAAVDSLLLVHYHDIRFDRALQAMRLPLALSNVVQLPPARRGADPWVTLKFRLLDSRPEKPDSTTISYY